MKVKKVTNPHAWELAQARLDESIVTGQPLIERPYHYENLENGHMYYDLYGCVGWPTEVSDKGPGMDGYCAVVGVVKPPTEGLKVQNAVFYLLAEFESGDVPQLINAILAMRGEWGFGLTPNLLSAWFGDPDRYIATLALKNERLVKPILITPPYDFYDTMAFDIYVRSLQSAILPGQVRFGFGGLDILKAKLREFRRDNPAVMSVGGLVHTLVMQTEWMDQSGDNHVFVVEGEGEI
jgi:hypothetical protein